MNSLQQFLFAAATCRAVPHPSRVAPNPDAIPRPPRLGPMARRNLLVSTRQSLEGSAYPGGAWAREGSGTNKLSRARNSRSNPTWSRTCKILTAKWAGELVVFRASPSWSMRISNCRNIRDQSNMQAKNSDHKLEFFYFQSKNRYF